jgi:hypothetical protein
MQHCVLGLIFFFIPQLTIVNVPILASETQPLRNWHVCNGLCSAFGKMKKWRRFVNTIAPWPTPLRQFTKVRSLTAQLAIRCLIVNYCTRWRCNFKGLSHDGGGGFFKKTSAPLFLMTTSQKAYSNFDRIHLADKYL